MSPNIKQLNSLNSTNLMQLALLKDFDLLLINYETNTILVLQLNCPIVKKL